MLTAGNRILLLHVLSRNNVFIRKQINARNKDQTEEENKINKGIRDEPEEEWKQDKGGMTLDKRLIIIKMKTEV